MPINKKTDEILSAAQAGFGADSSTIFANFLHDKPSVADLFR